MKSIFSALIFATFGLAVNAANASASNAEMTHHGYPIEPVPFTSVKIDDPFWGQRLEAARNVTIPLAFSKCEESGRYDNFIKAANPSESYEVGGFPFDDTDVYKTIEGASYLLQTYPDKKLEAYIDSVLTIVAGAQEEDGYLNTSFTMNPAKPHSWMAPGKRWERVEILSHEFYNLGHMIDGAVAHYQATGKRNFLDIAIRYADCVCRSIGDAPGQLTLVPGHQIAEMALARLYLVTGDRKYLDQAKFFLDKRGYTARKDAYSQAHKPVVEQDEAVGHAVRASYMYAGMADVAALTGDSAYINAIDRIWDNIVNKKYYITGGIGATHKGEAFDANYVLPNEEAYCETCAAIGNVYVNHRLFLLHGDAKYYDVVERTLYNGLIAGMSIDGGKFFYPNPLASEGNYERQPWFGCACCPSNICRFIPSIPGYVYAVKDKDVYVNLYIGNSSELSVAGKKVMLSQKGDYTREGNVTVSIDGNRAGEFSLKLRIPGRLQGKPVPSDLYSYIGNTSATPYSVRVNGEEVKSELDKGYMTITRKWKKGDTVELNFDMTPRMIAANDNVKADIGRVAVERGPLVYCAEWPDNDFDIQQAVVNPATGFEAEKTDRLNGITILHGKAQLLTRAADGNLALKDVNLSLIPYYAWAHRGQGQMSVWLPMSPSATRPLVKAGDDFRNEFETR
ncbi:glycoside hydrolase family 127 protein [uncultured Duncaniella sp.]|uniref:glycoside hydrolase family 127 protein n=2 Tax=uncultured Duncaniella sp. TaxID=2768039 RepID=UPI00351D05A3